MATQNTYADAPSDIKQAVEALIESYGADPALLAGAIVSATYRAIKVAKAEECEACAAALEEEAYGNPVIVRFATTMASAIRKRGEA